MRKTAFVFEFTRHPFKKVKKIQKRTVFQSFSFQKSKPINRFPVKKRLL